MYKNIIVSIIIFFSISCLSAQKKHNTDWLFIYYMPYDNNLSGYGDTIKSMLKSGLVNKNIMVTIQSSFTIIILILKFTALKMTSQIPQVVQDK